MRNLESPPKPINEEKTNEEETGTRENNPEKKDNAIPGLPVDEAKKALKKAIKQKKAEKKKASEAKPKKLEDLKKDNFLSKDAMNEFVFNEVVDSDSDEDPNDGKTPTTANGNLDKRMSRSGKKIQKEELWRKNSQTSK